MTDRAQRWAIAAFLGILALLAVYSAFADASIWRLVIVAIDAKTGEQLTEGARFTRAGVRSEFVDHEACLAVLAELGGIPAHDGVAVYVVCQKVEIERIGT